ncbi:endonuclease VII domain-containing protein [Streptomyces sp. NPDC057136]|uniref:endonuclease VII domain-containing protein n=1 Tax=Streptomyces sp. NPDC057136 TaxID=3346029 RepID=UPI00362DC2E5
MLISREYALSLFADLTQNAMVPLDPDELLHMPGLAQHGHVFFGDIAVRCYKHKGRWMYDERDIRRTGQALAELRLDLDDVVDVQLPAYRDFGENDPEEWHRVDWRRHLVSRMFRLARHKAQDGVPYEERWDSWKRVGANGLPGDLTWEEFVASCSRYWHSQNMAGTRPLELLTWSGEKWLLPRAYIDFLDRWAQREEKLVDLARVCTTCGAQGPYWGDWRTSTSKGYVTRCPPCSGAAFRPYAGHLRGVQYESSRRRGTRADDYLCCLCKKSQASVWDHCHEHGHVRGPLCGSCNTREGKATPYYFLQVEGSTLHLLECRGCLEQRTLPSRFHLDVVRAHLEQTERHGRCRKQPYAHELEPTHGVHRFKLECSGWHTASLWAKNVTASETTALVRAFVDAALAAQEGRPSFGTATGAG